MTSSRSLEVRQALANYGVAAKAYHMKKGTVFSNFDLAIAFTVLDMGNQTKHLLDRDAVYQINEETDDLVKATDKLP